MSRLELIKTLKGEEEPAEDLCYYTPAGHESDMGYEMLRRTETLGIRLEVREVEGRFELFAPAGKMPDDLKERCKVFREEIIRAVWMKKALDYLAQHGAEPPFDVAEDLERSFADDTLEEFRDTVRAWIRELLRAGRGVA